MVFATRYWMDASDAESTVPESKPPQSFCLAARIPWCCSESCIILCHATWNQGCDHHYRNTHFVASVKSRFLVSMSRYRRVRPCGFQNFKAPCAAGESKIFVRCVSRGCYAKAGSIFCIIVQMNRSIEDDLYLRIWMIWLVRQKVRRSYSRVALGTSLSFQLYNIRVWRPKNVSRSVRNQEKKLTIKYVNDSNPLVHPSPHWLSMTPFTTSHPQQQQQQYKNQRFPSVGTTMTHVVPSSHETGPSGALELLPELPILHHKRRLTNYNRNRNNNNNNSTHRHHHHITTDDMDPTQYIPDHHNNNNHQWYLGQEVYRLHFSIIDKHRSWLRGTKRSIRW